MVKMFGHATAFYSTYLFIEMNVSKLHRSDHTNQKQNNVELSFQRWKSSFL